MSPWELLLAALLTLWFVTAVINQLPISGRLKRFFHRFDPASLIPAWTFFAPRPGTTDYAVLYRDATLGGDLTGWRRLASGSRSVRWAWAWHPDKRVEKLVTDLVPNLAASVGRGGSEYLTSIPYLTLMAAVVRAEHDFRATSTQMAVMAVENRHASARPGVVFISAQVPLETE